MFLPYDDINPTERTPFVTWCILGVNIAVHVFLALVLFPSASQETLSVLKESYTGCLPEIPGFSNLPVRHRYELFFLFKYGLVPANAEPMTFLYSMFLHGGWMHLIGNMLFLWITGDNLEDRFGHVPFLVIYLVCGLAAAFAQILMAGPGMCRPMIGASGAIAGAMGAYLLLFPKSQIKILMVWFPFVHTFRIDAVWWLGLWILFQLLSGAQQSPGGGGVAYWAHIGGFAAGFLIALAAWLSGWVDGGMNPPDPQRTWKPDDGPSRQSPWGNRRRKRKGPW